MAGEGGTYVTLDFDTNERSANQAISTLDRVEQKSRDLSGAFSVLTSLLGQAADGAMDMASSMSEAAGIVQSFVGRLDSFGAKLKQVLRLKGSLGETMLVLSGVFSLAATASYKFVKSVASAEMELEKLAKREHKTVEQTRASQIALETMGKTMADIKADQELKKSYDELVKINEQMALPNMSDALSAVKGLRSAFWQLKDTAKYALDWIGARVLQNLEYPIKRITDKLSGVGKWLRNNLDSVTMKISSGITAFIKGIEGLVEGVTKILQMVDQLDPNIRKLGGAILFIMGLIKSGPLGQILALVTAIGGVIDDAENYRYNQEHGLTSDAPFGRDANGRAMTEDEAIAAAAGGTVHRYVETAFTRIWDIIFGAAGEGMSAQERMNATLDTIFGGITTRLDDFTQSLREFDLFEMLVGSAEEGRNQREGFLSRLSTWLGTEGGIDKVHDLLRSLFTAISSALAEGGDIISDLVGIFVTAFTHMDEGTITAALGNNSVATAAGAGLLMKMLGFGDTAALVGAIVAGVQDLREQALQDPSVNPDDMGQVANKMIELLGIDFKSIADLITHGIAEACRTAGGLAAGGIGAILHAIFTPDASSMTSISQQVVDDLNNNDLFSAITGGISTWMITGNAGYGILGMLSTLVDSYFKDPDGLAKFKEDAQKLVKSIQTIWHGTWNEAEGKWDENGLRSMLKPLWDEIWQGPDGEGGLSGILKSMWDKASEFISGTMIPEAGALFRQFWAAVTADMPPVLRFLFGGNTAVATQNPDGTTKFTSGKGKSLDIDLTARQSATGPTVGDVLYKYTPHPEVEEYGDLIQGSDRAFTMPVADDWLKGWAPGGDNWFGGRGKEAIEDSNFLWTYLLKKGRVDEAEQFQEALESYISGPDTPGKYSKYANWVDKTWEQLIRQMDEKEAVSPLSFDELLPQAPNPGSLGSRAPGLLSASAGGVRFSKEQLARLYGINTEAGNVNLLNRKIISAEEMRAAGYSEFNDGDYATLYGSTFTGGAEGQDLEYSKNVVINATPITPDGKVLSEGGLSDYLQGLLTESDKTGESIFSLDKTANGGLGLVMSVDFVEDGDFAGAIESAVQFAESLHESQAVWDEIRANYNFFGEAETLDPNGLLPQLQEQIVSLAEADYGPVEIPVGMGDESLTSSIDNLIGSLSGKFVEIAVGLAGGTPNGGGNSGGHAAYGGRFGSATDTEVGEDGTEYVIPITKPSRAAELIKQMFGEMGTSAVNQIIGDLGIGMGAGTVGADYASIASAMGGGSSITTNNNVSAPVNIYVTASGVGAEDVGERAYDAAQRQMLRTLKGVFA